MRSKKALMLLLILMPLVSGAFLSHSTTHDLSPQVRLADVGDGEVIELGPDETLHKFTLSDMPTVREGTGAPLNGSEYGSRTDMFPSESIMYNSTSRSTNHVNLTVPIAKHWEAYEVFANVTSLTENRTWLLNPSFDNSGNWTYGTHNEMPGVNAITSEWDSNGHGAGDGSTRHQIFGDPSRTYDLGDKGYATQNISLSLGEIVWVGVSLDYYARFPPLPGTLTGYFELFVSLGDPDKDPDDDGERDPDYFWSIQFNEIQQDSVWYSTGIVEVDTSITDFQNAEIWAGLRSVDDVRYGRNRDPEGRLDNIEIYIKSKATPGQLNLKTNDKDVEGTTPGQGQLRFPVGINEMKGTAYADFSWTPIPATPDPNRDITVDLDVTLTAYAWSYNDFTKNNTASLTNGSLYSVWNATDVDWETNFLAIVPEGYENEYFFSLSIPDNRDVYTVAEPDFRHVNLTSGWTLGDPLDGAVNVSVYDITTTSQNGFWLVKGTSPNMITNLQVWNDDTSQWLGTEKFGANNNTRFRATLSSSYAGNTVYFTVYDPDGAVWIEQQAVVDSSGYATTSMVNLDAYNASVGAWEVQAFVDDSVSGGGSINNLGYYRRGFSIGHGTSMSVKYPVGSDVSWNVTVVHGTWVLLQLRVNDTDNGDFLPGGTMTYSWAAGSGAVSDLGTGEYSVTLDTGLLASNGEYDVTLQWNKGYYDPLVRTFKIVAILNTDLFSSDAPGIDVPSGYIAQLSFSFRDQYSQGIADAELTTNWSYPYTVTQVMGQPGDYTVELNTTGAPLETFLVSFTASKDYYETRTVILSIQVRELHTSAIPSTSLLSLPVGYIKSLRITYTDSDSGSPISGAAWAIRCNWSDIHSFGDQNYTVVETGTPGEYEVTIYSEDTDVLGTYSVVFNVEMPGAQNHTFIATLVLKTHLTSFSLVNPIDPTPYTGNVRILVYYYDADADAGIENGTSVGYFVDIEVRSSTLPLVNFAWANGTVHGEYILLLSAAQWGSIGDKDLTILCNWTGPTVKFYNRTISTSARITGAQTQLFMGDSPVMTPYGENVSFSVVYWDVGGGVGVVNSTGPYAGNVHLYVDVLTSGQLLTQSLMMITEVNAIINPGEYRIEFNTTYLSGLISCDLRIWLNWTKAALPYYKNQTLLLTVYATYRQTTVGWTPMPVTPYDEFVNLTLTYQDALSTENIRDSPSLLISTPGYAFSLFYEGDATAVFKIQVSTSAFGSPGTHTFQVDIIWSGSPFYQNKTGMVIPITVRERHTQFTHGSYAPVQYSNNLTIIFTYLDLDDFPYTGVSGGTITLDSSLGGFYSVWDNSDGTYTLKLNTSAYLSLGTFQVNATMTYGGVRFCADATDTFYLTVARRITQLTGDLPQPAPFLTLANLTVHYIDDSTSRGIMNADVSLFSATASQPLVQGVTFWVVNLADGVYEIGVDTGALDGFGSHIIDATLSWSGPPFYQQRTISITVEVTRRSVSFGVSKSPVTTPFKELVVFEISITDSLTGAPVLLNKSVLLVTHGSGTEVPPSQYTLAGYGEFYTISINSTVLTSVLVADHPIQVKFYWGDWSPFYANATTSTLVTIGPRFTQATVLSTPPASYSFNLTALVKYSDYLSGSPITNAAVSILCVNDTTFARWIIDNGDGTYSIIVDTNDLSGIGRYFFEANLTWLGSPFYRDVIGVEFSVVVTPVATVLNFALPSGVVYYLGDIVYGNITYFDVTTGLGIDGAEVATNWTIRHGTESTITPMGNGIYQLVINTSTLDAKIYTFSVNASKFQHFNRSITTDILLAAIPVEIELQFAPTDPTWGDVLELSANVTDARTGQPILGAAVNLTIASIAYDMVHQGGGIYNATVPTGSFDSGEYSILITSVLLNHETRQKTFQIRIQKVAANIIASIDPLVSVNGQSITIEVDYFILSNSTPISVGVVTYSWIGGSGTLSWQPAQLNYTGQFIVDNAPVGNHQILVQASSSNFKTVSVVLTIEVRETNTGMRAYQDNTVLSGVFGDLVNVTVYLNDTDVGRPVTGATLTYGVGTIVGSLTDHGNGYYSVGVPTGLLEIGVSTLTVASVKDGFTPSSLQFTLTVEKVPTNVVILSNAVLEKYYGENATFLLMYRDSHNSVGIPGATSGFILESVTGSLVDLGNGNYELIVNTTAVVAGVVAHDISVSFVKDGYTFTSGLVKLVVRPIPTEVLGPRLFSVPVGDDYSQSFQFYDSLNGELLDGATATAIWEFGSDSLTPTGNGTYVFGPAVTGIPRLEIREEPYILKIQMTKGNYSFGNVEIRMTIREIATEIVFDTFPSLVVTGVDFEIRLRFMDVDHQVPIFDAINVTDHSRLTRLVDQEYVLEDGTYVFVFRSLIPGYTPLVISFSKIDYQTATYTFDVYSRLSPEAQAMANTVMGAGLLLIFIVGAAGLYVRVLSVPKLLRILRRMVSNLARGVIPDPAAVRSRREMILEDMNTDLKSVELSKTLDDIAMDTLEVGALDVQNLVDELAQVIGLTEADIAVMMSDLERMRPSERAGFITEVLKQERARRAKELAEAEIAEEEVAVPEEAKLSEEELADLKERLLKLGIEESEADIMVEQARSLTRAEIRALLEEIGGLEE
ncbi:MAG: hypothetical protein ACE5H4_09120 [Candidatus Thorarchaeota archaeon]